MNSINTVPSEKQSFFQKATLFVICVYAVSLYVGYISSALLSLQGLTLYAMVGLFALVVIQKGSLRLNAYFIWYGLFMALALFSCIYAPNRGVAFSEIYSLLIVLVFALTITMVVTKREHIEYILIALLIGSSILTVYLAVTGGFENYSDAGSRFGGELTGNANIFASVYMIAAAASVYFLFKLKNKRFKLAVLASFVMQLYALVVSGGRKYFIFPFILIYLMALQKRDKKSRSHVIRVTLIFALLLFIIYRLIMDVDFLYENIGYRFEDLINYASGQYSDVEGGTIIREKMTEKGLELWAAAPFMGHGADMFSVLGGFGVYSHNNFVEMLCNHGIIGFIWYYGFYLYVVIKLLKMKNNDTMRHFLIGFVVSLLVYETGAIAYDTLVTQMFLIFSVVYMRLRSHEDTDTE